MNDGRREEDMTQPFVTDAGQDPNHLRLGDSPNELSPTDRRFSAKVTSQGTDENALVSQSDYASLLLKIKQSQSLETLNSILQNPLLNPKARALPNSPSRARSLTSRNKKAIKQALYAKATDLVISNTTLGSVDNRSIGLSELRATDDNGKFTHTSMRMLMTLIEQAIESEYRLFLFQVLKARVFDRPLRQPDRLCYPSQTWRTIVGLLASERNRQTSASELTPTKANLNVKLHVN